MSDCSDMAVRQFRDGFNCAQAVLSTFADGLGLPRDIALRIATPFGGGIARTGQTCGAITGALMVLGLGFGTTNPADKEAKERQYRVANDFLARFRALHGSTLCSELLGCDISTPEGRQAAQEQKLFMNFCPGLIADSTRLVGETLKTEQLG
jgi:C_GCAxxG_C_C family probable redox protein